LIAWGLNTVFELPVGWDVKIIESNGRGHESFDDTQDRSDREYAITIVGQVVTIDGGTGFSNQDVHKSVRADLIKATAEPLDQTINSQILPQWVAMRSGNENDALDRAPSVHHETRTPEEIKSTGEAATAFARGVMDANQALERYGFEMDAPELARRSGMLLRRLAKVEPAEVTEPVLEEETDDEVDDDSPNAQVIPIRGAA
jgi:phage gp29-like protein